MGIVRGWAKLSSLDITDLLDMLGPAAYGINSGNTGKYFSTKTGKNTGNIGLSSLKTGKNTENGKSSSLKTRKNFENPTKSSSLKIWTNTENINRSFPRKKFSMVDSQIKPAKRKLLGGTLANSENKSGRGGRVLHILLMLAALHIPVIDGEYL